MPDIVVVTYNSAAVIDRCLDACFHLLSSRVIVVDNASTDNTVEQVRRRPQVQLIANPSNLGFAAAANQGFDVARGPAVLLLNPDATPVRGIEALERSIELENVGAATGRLIGDDGKEQSKFHMRALPSAWTLAFEVLGLNRLWPANPVNRRYRGVEPGPTGEIEQPAGAFLMVRRSAWAQIGGFDEEFFPIWFEDVDFCKRLRDADYKIRYVPEAEASHLGGHSASKIDWSDRQVFWYGSLLRYAWKHLPAGSRRAVALAVMVTSVPRTVTGIFQVGFSESTAVYSKVFRLAGEYLRKGERGYDSPGPSQPAKEQLKSSR